MPKLAHSVPKYRKHRATGQAVVNLNGRDHYLGPYGTKISRSEYDRLIQEWLSRGRTAGRDGQSITVIELISAYMKWARQHYRKGGKIGIVTSVRKNLWAAAIIYPQPNPSLLPLTPDQIKATQPFSSNTQF